MRNREEIAREVEGRNQLRAEVGLPLVSIPEEVEKIYKAELWQDFRDWCDQNCSLLRDSCSVRQASAKSRRRSLAAPCTIVRKSAKLLLGSR